MSRWAMGTANATSPLLPGRRRRHQRVHLFSVVVGGLIVLAVWGFSELVR